jgi:hypothetical protein
VLSEERNQLAVGREERELAVGSGQWGFSWLIILMK